MRTSLIINPSAFEAGLEAAFLARSSATSAQETAFARFAKTRLPNRRVEGWKWSDFNAALRKADIAAPQTTPETIGPSLFGNLDPLEIRIMDGRIDAPTGEQPKGIRFDILSSVGTAPALDAHPIAALNIAMSAKSFGLEVERDTTFDRPILLRHINTGGAQCFAQSILRISPGASATIIETFEGVGSAFSSYFSQIAVRDGAKMKRYVVFDQGADAVVHSLCAAKLDVGASFEQTSVSTGGKLVRHETILHAFGADAKMRLDSAALLRCERHNDFTTDVLHKAEGCETSQLYKGIAADKARAVFQGKFEVQRAAQKTDATMTANALLLSELAEANHKPELEIYADDVECAHGSTCGSLDDDALFYLRQRGLTEHQARALLIEAFIGEVIDRIDDEKIREIFAGRVGAWLEAS